MQPLVSVIVPVYKVEEYLPRCLDSICRQSLKNIEILLIDDGSPDRCGEICEQYAANDTRCKVIHHSENKGLSAARNTGIRQATADYLMFVDSDDWVHKDFCKDAYECAICNHADLVMFNFQYVKGTVFLQTGHKYESSGFKSREDSIELLFRNFAAWNKLYRKELFNGIWFPEGHLFEDVGTTYKLFWNASKLFYLDNVLYYYSLRPDSIMTSKWNLQSLRQWFEMHLQLYNELLNKGYPKEQLDSFFQKIALTFCIKKRIDFTDDYYIISANMIRKPGLCYKKCSWKQNVLIKLFQFSPTLFDLTCMLLKKHVD